MNTDKKKWIAIMAGITGILVFVLVLLIMALLQKDKEPEPVTTVQEEIQEENVPEPTEELEKEKPKAAAPEIEDYLTHMTVHLHLEGYMKSIFNGWDWVLQDELTAYVKEHEIDATNATVLMYIGYDEATKEHSFYIQLDDSAGTILLGKFYKYGASVEEANKTEDEILKEKAAQGDEGMPDDVVDTTPTVTPTAEPTKAPIIPYADMEIQEFPQSLIDELGTNATELPAALAAFLVTQERTDTYAIYDGNLKSKNNKITFDLRLQDGKKIAVGYSGEYSFEMK